MRKKGTLILCREHGVFITGSMSYVKCRMRIESEGVKRGLATKVCLCLLPISPLRRHCASSYQKRTGMKKLCLFFSFSHSVMRKPRLISYQQRATRWSEGFSTKPLSCSKPKPKLHTQVHAKATALALRLTGASNHMNTLAVASN